MGYENGVVVLTGIGKPGQTGEVVARAALAKGARSIDAMLPDVYDDTPEEAWPLAARSLESILLHLEREGRARREGEGWRAA